ncbi:MAG: 30S ribosomal protein S16 [Phycisphaera sp.]|nr:30S ribosomal protein S16 [Phycisphaera sp.]
MSVKLRLSRMGNRHRPFYRINAIDSRKQRDGRVIEQLGWFNPLDQNEAQQSELKVDRIAYWLSVGAQPSATVSMLIKRIGLNPTPGTKVEAQPTVQPQA